MRITKRHIQMLKLIRMGMSNEEIAVEMGIALNTVKVHTNRLFKSIGASNRTHAVAIAVEHGLLGDIHTEKIISKAQASLDECIMHLHAVKLVCQKIDTSSIEEGPMLKVLLDANDDLIRRVTQ